MEMKWNNGELTLGLIKIFMDGSNPVISGPKDGSLYVAVRSTGNESTVGEWLIYTHDKIPTARSNRKRDE